MLHSLPLLIAQGDAVSKLITIVLLAIAIFCTASVFPTLAVPNSDAATLFTNNCAGCHIDGGNIVRRGKNLQQKALKKYHMDSVEAISQLVANGKNVMPAYKDRLTEQEILDVSAYVLEQAQKGWK